MTQANIKELAKMIIDITGGTKTLRDQVKSVAETKKDKLTGKTLYARCREVIGTCVSMRVKIEGMEPKVALKAMSEGEFQAHFS